MLFFPRPYLFPHPPTVTEQYCTLYSTALYNTLLHNVALKYNSVYVANVLEFVRSNIYLLLLYCPFKTVYFTLYAMFLSLRLITPETHIQIFDVFCLIILQRLRGLFISSSVPSHTAVSHRSLQKSRAV